VVILPKKKVVSKLEVPTPSFEDDFFNFDICPSQILHPSNQQYPQSQPQQQQEQEHQHLQHFSLQQSLPYSPLFCGDSLDREPRHVNPKQYHRILKRRQQRAKYFQNHVVIKQDKPYKHQSRHEHAQRRQRGQGGRFLKRQTSEPLPQLSQPKQFKQQEHTSFKQPIFPDLLHESFMIDDVFSSGAFAA